MIRLMSEKHSYEADTFRTPPAEFVPAFPTTSFTVPQILLDYVENNIVNTPGRPMSLVLCGATRTGKTQWARYLIN